MEKKKILIADDNEWMLDSLKEIMELADYKVECTKSGNTILAKKGDFPDLILMDIWMAGEDGREICRELKSRKITKDIPIIIISASHQLENSALKAGADDFVAKPFRMNELLGKVQKYLHYYTKR